MLGGDFYDVVECDDGAVFALIGDVAGHGPDEAALGVCLRIAWRTLVLSGADPDAIFGAMDAVLVSERSTDEVFATVAMVRLDRADADAAPAGGPGTRCRCSSRERRCVPAPVEGARAWRSASSTVAPGRRSTARSAMDTSLLLFTDGLIEGFDGHPGADGSGELALYELLAELLRARAGPRRCCWTSCCRGPPAQRRRAHRRRRGPAPHLGGPGVSDSTLRRRLVMTFVALAALIARPGGRGRDRCRSGCTAPSRRWSTGCSRPTTAAADVNAALLDQETGFRGYALTGNEDFLAPYDQGREAAAERAAAAAGGRERLPGLTQQPGRHGAGDPVLAAARWPTRASRR